jgi:hypothetical protein
MPQAALVRNLGKMTAVGLLAPMSDASRKVARQLTDADRLARACVHPVALLSALRPRHLAALVLKAVETSPSAAPPCQADCHSAAPQVIADFARG